MTSLDLLISPPRAAISTLVTFCTSMISLELLWLYPVLVCFRYFRNGVRRWAGGTPLNSLCKTEGLGQLQSPSADCVPIHFDRARFPPPSEDADLWPAFGPSILGI